VELKGKWALITGASSGIGADIARELGTRGLHLLLVARRQERLDQLAAELRRDFGIQAETDSCDLQEDGAAAALFERATARGREIEVLVNNAGFAVFGDFVEQDLDRLRRMVRLNVLALTELTYFFGRAMAERGHGFILEVSSIAGVSPLPSYAAYGATKAFVLSLSGALAHELRGRDVSVTALLPGATWTEFFDTSGQKPTAYTRAFAMSSRDVAKIGVKAMIAGRPTVIAGWRNWLSIKLASIFPRHVRAWLTWQVNRNR
jgi:short-subunit dehydrogenase